MKLFRWLGYSLVSVALVLALLLFGARLADGPIEIVAGGPFTSGEMVSGPEPDWSFVRNASTVELQLITPPRSRTTWIIEHDGKVYIPCGYMTTTWGKIWKKWPIEAELDGRAILRVDGKLYRRHLVRVKSGPALESVVRKLSEKYAVPATMDAVDSGSLWVFEMAPSRQAAEPALNAAS
jgi:hypothetical protein